MSGHLPQKMLVPNIGADRPKNERQIAIKRYIFLKPAIMISGLLLAVDSSFAFKFPKTHTIIKCL